MTKELAQDLIENWNGEDFESGKISPWDTLCEFWYTCDDYEPKQT